MSFKKYPSIRRMGHPDTDEVYRDPADELIITEKLDGNNFRFTFDGDESAIRYGSRNTNLGVDVEEIGGQFEDVTNYIDSRVEVGDILDAEEHVDSEIVVFGENLGFEHLIRDYHDETPTYQIFDVYCVDDDRWARRDEVETVAEILGLPVTPVVERTSVSEFSHTEYEIPPSVWRPASEPPEGVVIENQTTMCRGKMLTEEFLEKKEEGYGSPSSNNENDDTYEFVHRYVTDARIKKQIHKMVSEEDRDLEMELMSDLHERVWEDAWEEEWKVMIYEDSTINLKQGHELSARKTASVLEEMIRNRDEALD